MNKHTPGRPKEIEKHLEVRGHTVKWLDGLKVVRVYVEGGRITLWLTWQGVRHEVRLGQRLSEIRRCGKEDA